MNTLADLAAGHCRPGARALSADECARLVALLEGWSLDGARVVRTFRFEDYYRTLAFVNAVAFVAHREDHHPDLDVRWGSCAVAFSTHDAGGLTLNDFVCAARVSALAQ